MDSFAILPTTIDAMLDRDAHKEAIKRLYRNGGALTGYDANGDIKEGIRALLPGYHKIYNPNAHMAYEKWLFEGEWEDSFPKLDKALRERRAWPKTLEDYKKFQVEVDLNLPYMHQVRRHRVWDDLHGDSADIGRALVAIAPWEQFRRTAAKRAVTIGYHMSLNAMSREETFRVNAVAATRMSDALMAAGYDVRIIGVNVARGAWNTPENRPKHNHGDQWVGSAPPDWIGYTFPIKEFGSPLDEQAMLALGTPAMLRSLSFNHTLELFPQIKYWDHAGQAKPLPLDIQAALGIDVMIAKQFDRGTAASYIESQAQAMKEKLEGGGNDTVDPFATTREE
jgi:hypothetical protein